MSKTILVTGVSRGLGLEIARAVLARGWTVLGVARAASAQWEALRAGAPDRARFFPFDLADPDGVRTRLFKEFSGLDGPLDGFVNNAAVAYDDLVTNLRLEPLERMFAINVFSPMMVVRQFIRNLLLHDRGGSIVHVSSISAHTGYKGLAMYAATKGALEAFSKNTAREWGERGVRSNCVVAGFMATDMNAGLTDEQRERIYRRTALKRPVAPASVAAMVVHLLGEESASVTGQNMFVDCGTI